MKILLLEDDLELCSSIQDELLARIRALIRRPAEIRQETCICFSDLSFSQTEHILSRGTNSLLLTARES